MSEDREQWLRAGAILAKDPSVRVKCPECGHYNLDVTDKDIDESHFERHIHCPECNGHEAILIRKADQSKRP